MYKVFLNDRIINIVAPGKITLKQPAKIVNNLGSKRAVKEWFYEFIKNADQEVVLQHGSPGEFFSGFFMPAFKLMPAAGGVVIRRNKLLFIFRNNKWDFPKGKIDERESPRDAAVREVGEECGIAGHKIIKELPSTFHIYKSPYKKSKGEWILKETFWFEMEYSGIENGIPQTEEDITAIKWFETGELGLPLKNTYANLKQLILLYTEGTVVK